MAAREICQSKKTVSKRDGLLSKATVSFAMLSVFFIGFSLLPAAFASVKAGVKGVKVFAV